MFAKRILRTVLANALLMLCLAACHPASAQNISDIEFGAQTVGAGLVDNVYVILSSPAGPNGAWIYLTSQHPEFASFSGASATWIWIPPGWYYNYSVMYTYPVPSRRIDLISATLPGANARGKFLTIVPY